MPSTKRRMMLTLPDELAAALDDFREATGTAPSSFIVSMLVEAIPMLKAVADAHRSLAEDENKALTIMQSALSGALHQGAAVQLDLYEKPAVRKARREKPSK